jgi:ABC-type transporter Mla maintaining outer membrane lipid asymmetry ATPase subunit MlaF
MSAERQAIIRVENFTAAYNGQVVLEEVNFEVFKGEIFFIVGRSGSG